MVFLKAKVFSHSPGVQFPGKSIDIIYKTDFKIYILPISPLVSENKADLVSTNYSLKETI